MKRINKLFYLVSLLIFALPVQAQLWSGVLPSNRATDWTKAGIPGGIPSGSWTQCGSTIAAYNGTAAAINTQIAGCSPNTYVLLGPGVFNLTTAIVVSNTTMKRNVVLRGSGADTTFLVFSNTGFVSCSNGTGNASICVGSNDTSYSGAPANVCDVTAGFTVGSTTLTLSGSCNMGNFVANQTMVQLDQADDGYSFPANSFSICNTALTSNVATIVTCATNNFSTNQNVQITGINAARGFFNVDTTLTEPITRVNGTTFTFPINHADSVSTVEAAGTAQGFSSGYALDNGGFFNVSDKYSTKVDISAVTCGGGNATYTYIYNSSFQLPTNADSPLYVGESAIITALADAGNNGTFKIASRALGTFTVVNAGCVPAVTQTGTGVAGTLSGGGPAYIGPVGRQVNGPGHVNQRLHRNQNETFLVTGIAGNVITLNAPVVQPNWSLGQSPQVWLANAVTNDGVEDLSMDLSAITTPNSGILFGNACYDWVKGVRMLSARTYGVYGSNICSMEFDNNYLYRVGQDGGYGDAGAFKYNGSHNLIQNNIIHRATNAPFFEEGPTAGTVVAYNFATTYVGNGGNGLSVTCHETNRQELFEGNHFVRVYCSDGIHGSTFSETFFRNAFWAWMSCANGVCGGSTSFTGGFAFATAAGGRYSNVVGNVLGTPNLTGTHNYVVHGTCGSTACIMGFGQGNGNVPSPDDPISWTSALLWANWDAVTNGNRFCGNASDTGWASPCGSASEVPTGDAFFPVSVPTLGDTGIGQGALPASFYLSGKPAWVGSRPWPLIGPDVTGGNVKQCPGVQDTAGLQAKMPATSASSCAGAGAPTSAWGDHVNANPAMDVYLNTMGGLPDGSGPALTFNENYYTGASAPIVVLTTFPANFGSHTVGVSSGSQTFTLANTGTATLTYSSVTVTGTNAADFSITGGTCNIGGSTLGVGTSCTIIVVFTPSAPGARTANISVASNATSSPDTGAMSGTGQSVVVQSGGILPTGKVY